jgi:hypothetical protein
MRWWGHARQETDTQTEESHHRDAAKPGQLADRKGPAWGIASGSQEYGDEKDYSGMIISRG